MSYVSAEGGYQGVTYETYEIFELMELDFPHKGGDALRDELASAMPTDLWSENDPYGLNDDDQLQHSWDSFCGLIKHKLRYFFTLTVRDDDDEIFSPSQLLRLIFSYAKSSGALITLPKGTSLHRARPQKPGEKHTQPSSLGAPPENAAVQTNRMSPPGIVMMYVADDTQTALAETADKAGIFALGEFVTGRDALLLDLTHLPPVPSLFEDIPDTLEYDPRPRILFLSKLSREISRPIARDDRVHIEYLPTQVVTEYLRTSVTVDGKKVDGIRYRSSRNGVGTAIVLFANQDNIELEPEARGDFYHAYRDRWLTLKSFNEKRVTAKTIAKWSR
jgi:RES domain/HEPN/RES N-terminal domain 1